VSHLLPESGFQFGKGSVEWRQGAVGDGAGGVASGSAAEAAYARVRDAGPDATRRATGGPDLRASQRVARVPGYTDLLEQTPAAPADDELNALAEHIDQILDHLVGDTGIEPVTSSV
jgi:hypothetical protein